MALPSSVSSSDRICSGTQFGYESMVQGQWDKDVENTVDGRWSHGPPHRGQVEKDMKEGGSGETEGGSMLTVLRRQ